MGTIKRLFVLSAFAVSAVTISGCATGRNNQQTMEVQGLRNQIQALEAKLQEKDQEIVGLREAAVRTTEERQPSSIQTGQSTAMAVVAAHPTMKLIQTALKNAGYDPGPVDGHKGKKTVEAIKAFQKANGLKPDGKVGKKTWELLAQNLEKKVK